MTDTPVSLDRRDLLLSAGAAAVTLACPAAAQTQSPAGIGTGGDQPFDLGWRFHREPGEGAEAAVVDVSGWRSVDLPHDWSIEDLPADPTDPERIRGPFDRKAPDGTDTGFTLGGEGWYRKRFRLVDPRPGRVEILFEGVYAECDLWLNGRKVGSHRNGYTPFACDLTPFLAPDGDNVLAVHVRNVGHTSRWYSGSGIYRHVRLDVGATRGRLERWGTSIVTRRIVGGAATIEIGCGVLDVPDGCTLATTIRDAAGRTVWEGGAPATAATRQTLAIPNARLWSPDHPNLYTATVELRRGPAVLDALQVRFGVRVIAFDAVTGMTLNGAPIKLRGGCIHHDHGVIGAAAFDGAEQRKVALLRARGFNAVRPSHIPFSPAFLRACDEAGMMVIAETFDVWREPKTPGDYSRHFDGDWRADLDTIVRSARNHPGIVMWSIGNEIPGRDKPEGLALQWELANAVHRLDPTRPVTAAIHGFPGHEATTSDKASRAGAAGAKDRTSTAFLDVIGYNYKLTDYDADHARFPQRVFFGTESFPGEMFRTWEMTETRPWLIGDFVWTAMDYLGEAGIGGSQFVPPGRKGPLPSAAWPWVNAFCGDVDLIGNRKAASFARDVAWGLSPLEIGVQRPAPEGQVEAIRTWGWPDEAQSWTWPAAVGRPLTVRVYTSGDRVELRLNGRTVASRPIAPSDLKQAEFTLPYAPGELVAVAWRGETEIARRRLETVGAPAAIRLRAERSGGSAARDALTHVALEIVDARGRVVPDAEREIIVTVGGAGELLGFGSANPLAAGSYRTGRAASWNGRALLVVRGAGRPGKAIVMARGAGLKPAALSLRLA